MVRLRELLDDILDSVSGDDDDTWKVEIRNSREQRQMSLDIVVPHERKLLLELRVLNQDGLSQQLLLASRDIIAEHTNSSDSCFTVPNDDETTATSKARCSAHQDPGSHDVGQMNETDKGICSEEEEEDTEEEEEDIEAEEERERVRGHASELRTVDGVRKPADTREKLPFQDTTDGRAKQQEVRASKRLSQAKPNPLLRTSNKKRRGSTESLLKKKRRKEDATTPALLNKSQSNSDQNPSSDLRRNQEGTQGTEKHIEGPSASKHSRQQLTIRSLETYSGIIKEAEDNQGSRDKENKRRDVAKRQFREDCRDILDNIFKTMCDPKTQFISLSNPLPSYRVVDHVVAARNLEPVIDVIEDNEINHVLAAMLRVVNQVFLMRTIEVACAETPGSAQHAQGIVFQRMASHLQHRQIQRGKPSLSMTAALQAARQLKFNAYRIGRLCREWGTVCVLLASTVAAFTTKSRYTPKAVLDKIAPKMQGVLPTVMFVADCEHPEWRDVFVFCPLLQENDPSSLMPPSVGVNLREWGLDKNLTPKKLQHYIYINESRVGEPWNGDPRRVHGGLDIACVHCGQSQFATESTDESQKRCRCMGSLFYSSENPDRFLIFETEDRGFGVKALNTYSSDGVIGEFVGVVVKQVPKDRDILAGGANSMVHNAYYLDTTSEGNWTRFINHSCQKYNCVVNKYVWRGIEKMILQVRRGYTVQALDELTINYGNEYLGAQGAGWCNCESCRLELDLYSP